MSDILGDVAAGQAGNVASSFLVDANQEALSPVPLTPRSPAATLILPLPPKALSPNARRHFYERAEAVRDYRLLTNLTARNVRTGGKIMGQYSFLRAPILVDVIATYRFKRRRDEDNLRASLKPCWDGLVDAGLILDDTPEYINVNSVSIRVDPKHRGDGLRLLLWEAEA